MSKEILFDTDPLLLVPQGIKDRLQGYLDSVEEVLKMQEDVPHQKFHILEGIHGIRRVAPMLNLGVVEGDLAERTYRYHDLGYRLVTEGLITSDEHHYGSVLLAARLDPDRRVLSAILHHVDDVLPPGTPLWARLARDIDRTAIGYPGANRIAIYYGLDHPYLSIQDPEKVVEKGILCDFGNPLRSDYDSKAKEFFWNVVLPYLKENNKMGHLETLTSTWFFRFNGVMNNQKRDVERFINAGEIEERRDDWRIEPVMKEVKHMFYQRQVETDEIWRAANRYNLEKRRWYGEDIR